MPTVDLSLENSRPATKKTRALSIVIMGGGFETRNLGVAALALGTIAAIKHESPDAEIAIVDFARAPNKYVIRTNGAEVEVPLLNLRFSKNFGLPNNIVWLLLCALVSRIVPFSSIQSLLFRNRAALARLRNADAVLSLAGGDSFSDIYGFGRLLYVSLPQILTIILGGRLVVMPQTLGPFKTASGRCLARWILRRARAVFARDLESQRFALKTLRQKSVGYSRDMAFAMAPARPSNEKVAQLADRLPPGAIGINVSGLLMMGGYSRKNMFGLTVDYRSLIAEIVRRLLAKGHTILLTPHVLEAGGNPESDLAPSLELRQTFAKEFNDNIFVLEPPYTAAEIKYVIGKCDFFMGSRMHACIAALSQGIPAVGLAYSRKFAGVFESVGVGELAVSLETTNNETILARIDDLYRRREEFRSILQTTAPQARTQAQAILTSMSH